MKNRNIVVRALFAVAVAAGLASCAGTAPKESVGEYIDDSVITTMVKTRLAEDDLLKSFEIGVGTYQGAVQLSGTVPSQEAYYKAAKITMTVKGVRSITNNLVIK